MVKRIVLAERLDSGAAAALREELVNAQEDDLVLDATSVKLIGGLCLELFMCARSIWAANGQALAIEDPSGDFVEGLARFGLDVETLSIGDAA